MKPYISATNGRLRTTPSPLSAALNLKFGTRLATLHALLKKLPSDAYRHNRLVTQAVGVNGKAPPPVHACGSVACAFGHAVISGKFRGIPVEVEWGEAYDDSVYRHVSFEAKNNARSGDGLKRMLGDLAPAMYPDYVYDNRLQLSSDPENMEVAADAYFGPGAWAGIFGLNYTDETASKRTVLGRIRTIAEKCYGVEV